MDEPEGLDVAALHQTLNIAEGNDVSLRGPLRVCRCIPELTQDFLQGFNHDTRYFGRSMHANARYGMLERSNPFLQPLSLRCYHRWFVEGVGEY